MSIVTPADLHPLIDLFLATRSPPSYSAVSEGSVVLPPATCLLAELKRGLGSQTIGRRSERSRSKPQRFACRSVAPPGATEIGVGGGGQARLLHQGSVSIKMKGVSFLLTRAGWRANISKHDRLRPRWGQVNDLLSPYLDAAAVTARGGEALGTSLLRWLRSAIYEFIRSESHGRE
ncbi:hypothetical protein D9M68_103670 [compost metagenome]